jgi:polyisoprenoid-binding protein YceI
MKKTAMTCLLMTAMVAFSSAAVAVSYELDKAHSSIEFKVRHLAISKVTGRFADFDLTFDFESGKPETWKAEATIDAASIDTGNEDRDNHLRSEDFLFTEQHPTITFVSTGVKMESETEGKLMGDLTIRGVTKPVVFDLEILGEAEFMGLRKAGFTARGKVNRKDFGLEFHKVLETGQLVVGDKVEFSLEIEGNQKKEEPTG